MSDLEQIWTFNADPAAGAIRPIRTACRAGEFGHPHYDADDRKQYTNTHFRTEEEAWRALIDNVEAGQNNHARAYRQAQQTLRSATEALAVWSAFAAEVHEARRKLKAKP